jgi:hypothetical protein
MALKGSFMASEKIGLAGGGVELFGAAALAEEDAVGLGDGHHWIRSALGGRVGAELDGIGKHFIALGLSDVGGVVCLIEAGVLKINQHLSVAA